MNGTSIKVLVVDDHLLFRKVLIPPLENDAEIDVVGTASDGEMAVKLCLTHRPDVILTDLHMPRMDGFELIERCREASEGQPAIVILTGDDRPQSAQRALRLGARGFLLKDNVTEENLVHAIRSVMEGGVFIDAQVMPALLAELPVEDKNGALDGLDSAEITLLKQVALGHENKHIATTLNITTKTVSNRLSLLYSKLGIQNRVQAANLAYRAGLVSLDAISIGD